MLTTNPRLLIFDLDGTLFDTQPILNDILVATLARFGIGISTADVRASIDNACTLVGDRAPMPTEFSDQIDHSQYSDVFWDIYTQNYMRAVGRPFEGMPETVDELIARGYTLAVLSNKPHKYTYPIIATAFPEHQFAVVLGSSDDIPRKPESDGLLKICAETGIDVADTVMIGDLSADCKVSINAGCSFVAALWGYGKKKKFLSLGADTFADTPRALLSLFN